MILIVNCIVDEAPKERFDRLTVPRLATVLGSELVIRHLAEETPLAPAGSLPDGGFERLVLSGSELSAAEENPRDEELMTLIRAFADAGKPILGICYGHQMLARALGGHCRKATTPEFGWKRLATRPNALFEGLESMVTLHSHYDEVHDLPPEFETIASTGDCEIQAFQVAGRPIWGVQFHPEMGHEEGQRMLDSNLRTEPLAPELYVDELDSPAQADGNLRLFENFVRAAPIRGAGQAHAARALAAEAR